MTKYLFKQMYLIRPKTWINARKLAKAKGSDVGVLDI